MSPRLERAWLLYQQSRYDRAEVEVRRALADDPDDAFAHALLSQCLLHQKKYPESADEAERAIASDPGLPFAYFASAAVAAGRRYYRDAESAIQNAIQLDPTNADYYSLLAAIRAEQERWKGALQAAETGLEHDPEHPCCTNLRAMALTHLGRKDEAARTLEGALARDPDNAFAHANRGWSLLHERKPQDALHHFHEALRLEPDLDYARAGMIEAIKARYWFYRQVLSYFLWMSRLSPQVRWGVVIGLLVVQQVVAATARSNPELKPFLYPVLIAYGAFALTTWVAAPLSNLFLRLNRFGRLALAPEERAGANLVGVAVLATIGCLIYAATQPEVYDVPGWFGALGFALLMIPISGIYIVPAGWPRRVMALYTLGMTGLIVVSLTRMGIGLSLDGIDTDAAIAWFRSGLELTSYFGWTALASSFLANWLAGVQVKR